MNRQQLYSSVISDAHTLLAWYNGGNNNANELSAVITQDSQCITIHTRDAEPLTIDAGLDTLTTLEQRIIQHIYNINLRQLLMYEAN